MSEGVSGLRRLEILLKPIARQDCDLIQSARLFEQMGGAVNDFKLVHGSGGQLLDGRLIKTQDHPILSADQEQGRRSHSSQRRARQIGSASARNHGSHRGRTLGSRDQRGGGACARSEVSQSQLVQMGLPQNPVRDGYQALAEQRDVETQLRGLHIHDFFLFGEKVDQDGSHRAFIEHIRHMAVSGASPAAAAAVSKDDQASGPRRQRHISSEFDVANRHL